jgi:hypothetical protein
MSKFKVGQVLSTNYADMRAAVINKGGDPDKLVVRSLDKDGQPIFTYEDEAETYGWFATRSYTVVSEPGVTSKVPSVFMVCSESVYQCASIGEAEEWIKQQGAGLWRIAEVAKTIRAKRVSSVVMEEL